MSTVLVLGGSGQIGRFLIPRLRNAGAQILAISRSSTAVSSYTDLSWLNGNLYGVMPPLPSLQAIISLGPLDGLVHWLECTDISGTPRLIALSSMSALSKRNSSDADERALAQRLLDAEQRLATIATQRSCAWTIFRPTLIYGTGLDRSLTPLARFAQRWHLFPHIPDAVGLRQPVHAQDVAQGCLDALNNARSFQQTYELGGGERLPFTAMLQRVRASLRSSTLPIPIPLALVQAGFSVARWHPRFRHISRAAIQRLSTDLVADRTKAAADFNWRPRSFHPDANCWITPV